MTREGEPRPVVRGNGVQGAAFLGGWGMGCWGWGAFFFDRINGISLGLTGLLFGVGGVLGVGHLFLDRIDGISLGLTGLFFGVDGVLGDGAPFFDRIDGIVFGLTGFLFSNSRRAFFQSKTILLILSEECCGGFLGVSLTDELCLVRSC